MSFYFSIVFTNGSFPFKIQMFRASHSGYLFLCGKVFLLFLRNHDPKLVWSTM